MTERLRILIHISDCFQTLEILEKTLSDKNGPYCVPGNMRKYNVPYILTSYVCSISYDTISNGLIVRTHSTAYLKEILHRYQIQHTARIIKHSVVFKVVLRA